MSTKRARQDEEDTIKRPRITDASPEDEDYGVDVMNARLLESSGRFLVEQLNKHFISTVEKVDRQSQQQQQGPPLHPEGIPRYAFHQACADYRRGMREAELRYLGEPGSIMCFGSNEVYQQAMPELLNDEEQSELPRKPHFVQFTNKDGKVQKVAGSSFRQIAALGIGSAALDTSGRVWTWGSSDDGGLGRPTNDVVDEATPAPVIFPKKPDRNDTLITQVSGGAMHILYLSYNGTVYMSGTFKDADSGKFSVASSSDDPESIEGENKAPVAIPELTDVVSVHSGENFCVTIHGDRTIKTWGFGQMGELARSAKMVTPDENGNYHLKPDIYRILDKDNKFVGYDFDVLQKFMTPLPPIFDCPKQNKKVMNVGCGGYHLLVAAIDEGEDSVKLYASGLNQYGQLGLGDTENRHMLTRVSFFDDKEVGQLAGGQHFSLALNAAGDALYSCGRGDYGSLGLGPVSGEAGSLLTTFHRVHMPQGVFIKKIAAGDSTSMALTIDNELYTWGYEATTGHEGFDDIDCPYPRKLDLGDGVRVHDCDNGAQHGVLVATRDN